jgi:hypothetical protein
MDSIVEHQHEEALLMDIIANNHGSNNTVNEQDEHEADNYLNVSGDGIKAEEQPVAETRKDGQPSILSTNHEVYLVQTSITFRIKFNYYIYVSGAMS